MIFSKAVGLTSAITLCLTGIVIGVQVAIAGYQLLAKYQLLRWKEMALCVNCTDPISLRPLRMVHSPAKSVARKLRKITSSVAGADDGFGFLLLMLAVYSTRYANGGDSSEGGRLSGDVGVAIGNRVTETWPYIVLVCVAIGALIMFIMLTRNMELVDSESYLLCPTAFLREAEARHDEVNSCMCTSLNFGGFMNNGLIMPWSESHTTGMTWGRLISLGFFILLFRRIPAILGMYQLMPNLNGDEETHLVRVMIPAVYFLVLFSIVLNGLSMPGLNLIYEIGGVEPIMNDAVVVRRKSVRALTPVNAEVNDNKTFVAYNRLSKPLCEPSELQIVEERYNWAHVL
ncbi:sodium hydrogen exchanger family protein [Neurospora intermedia]|uniref:Sodium hydrogen exchanger family protein n=1 Tax=Neurospora intermedia TaxID=5142 RepID=A0ABR3D3Y2_NEUIN